jgi:tRNA A-37 threonylcarbamoyl transferase component Bud32
MPPDAIPTDSYVGKTNDVNWTAGPHGSNYKTDSFGKLSAKILTPKTDVHQKVVEELTLMIEESQESPTIQIKNLRDKNTKGPVGPITRKARNELAKLNTKYRNKVVDDIDNEVHKELKWKRTARDADFKTKRDSKGRKKEKWTKAPPNEARKKAAINLQKQDIADKVRTFSATQKDAEKVAQLNDLVKKMVADSNYSLEKENFGKEIGSGEFGSVYDSTDGKYVIKTGNIGLEELKTLYAMRDNPNFPTLINARFDTPFGHQSSLKNNPEDKTNLRRRGQYWYPDDQSAPNVDEDDVDEFENKFDRRYPHATGTFAMTKARGQRLADVGRMMKFNNNASLDTAKENFWKVRAALHRNGYSHNDMHDGNIYVDPNTGEVDIIDMGPSRKSVPAAFFAALAGLDDDPTNDDIKDYQLSHIMKDMPKHMRDIARKNIVAVKNYFYNQGWNPENLKGQIRLNDDDINKIIPELGIPDEVDDDELDEHFRNLIDILYDGLDGVPSKKKELESRMSKAFTQRSKERNHLDGVNRIRASKRKPLKKDTKVVPKKNLDYDD